jgi:hypothetical protein
MDTTLQFHTTAGQAAIGRETRLSLRTHLRVAGMKVQKDTPQKFEAVHYKGVLTLYTIRGKRSVLEMAHTGATWETEVENLEARFNVAGKGIGTEIDGFVITGDDRLVERVQQQLRDLYTAPYGSLGYQEASVDGYFDQAQASRLVTSKLYYLECALRLEASCGPLARRNVVREVLDRINDEVDTHIKLTPKELLRSTAEGAILLAGSGIAKLRQKGLIRK